MKAFIRRVCWALFGLPYVLAYFGLYAFMFWFGRLCRPDAAPVHVEARVVRLDKRGRASRD